MTAPWVLDEDDAHQEPISHFSGVLSTSPNIVDEFADPHVDIVTTAVGPAILEKIAPTIAKGLTARRAADFRPW